MLNLINNYYDYESDYCDSISFKHRQKYGQFFTPAIVAKFMVAWILDHQQQKSLKILDPAFGLGIFARLILAQADRSHQIFGFDIDQKIYQQASQIFANNAIVLKNEDYITADWDSQYDAVICNPPYFKFQEYDRQQKLPEIRKNLKIHLSGFTNLYTLFLVKAISQLNSSGKAAFLIPSEFMNADYGKLIKKFLIENSLLKYVIIMDLKTNLFNDAMTTSCILLMAKSETNNNNQVTFLTINNLDHLLNLLPKILASSLEISQSKSYDYQALKPASKWRIYYQSQNSDKYQNLVPLSTYAQVVRGIATGDNDYFTFCQNKQIKYQIKSEYLLPCITKSNQVKGHFFTEQHLQDLINQGKRIFLLKTADLKDQYIQEYLAMGEAKGVHQKYLTSHRKPWFKIEDRSPAPIWVNVFNRQGLRFVRNEANIYNLTTFHCVYPNLLGSHKLDILWSYLMTPLAQSIFIDNSREYALGLQKFEPNDLNNSLVINLDCIDQSQESEIQNILSDYRRSLFCNNRENSHQYLQQLNSLFKQLLQT